MENTIRLEDVLTPPGEGPEETPQFVIQRERTYTDEVICEQYNQLTNGLMDLLAKAEQNLQRMALESTNFKSKLNEFLPKKGSFLFFDISTWMPRIDHKILCNALNYHIRLYPNYKLSVETYNRREVGISELLEPQNNQSRNQIECALRILSDTKRTAEYFIINHRLIIR